LRDVYGVIFFERLNASEGLAQKNVTIFADGEVDRSPCGSGTSARLALLEKSGELPRGETLVHYGIVDSVFRARVVDGTEVEGIPAVITEVEGSAHATGLHHFMLDPEDPVGTGFLLR
jgi:proline racemase